jgi:hypothetical protein
MATQRRIGWHAKAAFAYRSHSDSAMIRNFTKAVKIDLFAIAKNHSKKGIILLRRTDAALINPAGT